MKISPNIKQILYKENTRQRKQIQLIASENFASNAVRSLNASLFTNKYAEGRPCARYYNGTESCDSIELYAESLACKLFDCEFTNVQPHSGSNANLSVCVGILNPYDTVLSLSLSSGGHLSHGHKVHFSGKYYNVINYGLDENEIIDYDCLYNIAQKHRPKMIISGSSSYSLHIDWQKIHNVAKSVDAIHLADISHYSGLIAGNVYPNPLKMHACDIATSTTHKTLRGPRGGIILWNDDKYTKIIHKGVFPGNQGGPLMHTIASKAQCFYEASHYDFHVYANSVITNAVAFANKFKSLGYNIVSNGTQSHMFVLNLSHLNSNGHEVAKHLEKNDIIVNKNTIPNDELGPYYTSGIRLGTAAMTTIGWNVSDFEQCALRIHNLIIENEALKETEIQSLQDVR